MKDLVKGYLIPLRGLPTPVLMSAWRRQNLEPMALTDKGYLLANQKKNVIQSSAV